MGALTMPSGTVKWFNETRGFGFIAPDDGGNDVFVHIKAVQKAGFNGLVEGAKVDFDVVDNRGKQAAEVSATIYQTNSTPMIEPFCHWTLQRRPWSVRSNLRSNAGLTN
jgi:CspA family cold shock protein